jgi:hypothetical protein
MELRALLEHLRMPTRREWTETGGAGLGTALVCWYFGVNAWHALLLGSAITVTALAVLAGSSAPDARDLSWRPGRRSNREGSRNDVANLAASLRSGWGFVGLTAERELMQIARRRLALEGLDLSNPAHRDAIERRLGTRAYRTLASPPDRMPSLPRLLHCLDMLDAIDPTHYPVPHPRAHRRGLLRIPFSSGGARDR